MDAFVPGGFLWALHGDGVGPTCYDGLVTDTPAEGTADMEPQKMHYSAFVLDTVTGKTETYEINFYAGEDIDAAWRQARKVVGAMNEREPGERYRINDVMPATILGS